MSIFDYPCLIKDRVLNILNLELDGQIFWMREIAVVEDTLVIIVPLQYNSRSEVS